MLPNALLMLDKFESVPLSTAAAAAAAHPPAERSNVVVNNAQCVTPINQYRTAPK